MNIHLIIYLLRYLKCNIIRDTSEIIHFTKKKITHNKEHFFLQKSFSKHPIMCTSASRLIRVYNFLDSIRVGISRDPS